MAFSDCYLIAIAEGALSAIASILLLVAEGCPILMGAISQVFD
jgi:hypothetical protein